MYGLEMIIYKETVVDNIIIKLKLFSNAFKRVLMFSKHQHSNIIYLRNKEDSYINSKPPEDILTHYGDAILRLAVSYLKNLTDGEDILQDTIIKYMEKKPKFNTVEHEKAWLLRVAGNLSKNKLKYNKVRMSDQLDENIIGEESSDLKFVWEAVMELPEKYREIIHLFYHEGYNTLDIGNMLNKKETTIRSLLHRGRKMLKDTLREEYDFYE